MASLSGAQFEADLPGDYSGRQGDGSTVSADLLRRVQRGERSVYGQIVLTYQDRLFNGVLRLMGDRQEASEITQEAFTRGLEKIDSFRGDAGVYTWLFRIAMNLAISQLRQKKRHRTFSLDRPAGGEGGSGGDDQASALAGRMIQARDDSPHEALERGERADQVIAALGRLDPDDRAVLVMRDVEGFDYQQMADIEGVPLGTLKSRLFRARVALRNELKGYMTGER